MIENFFVFINFYQMEEPSFETSKDGQVFDANDKVYYIDDNNCDIYQVSIKKKTENGYEIKFLDHDSENKEVDANRILPNTPTNEAIYVKQEEQRNEFLEKKKNQKEKKKKEIEKSKKKDDVDKDSHEKKHTKDTSKDVKKGKKKLIKIKKHKAPIMDNQLIINTAWKEGIRDKEHFKQYVKKHVKLLYKDFDNFCNSMNDGPLFLLGGYDDSNSSDQYEVKKFWKKSRSLWNKMFNGSKSVGTKEFVTKLTELVKLPNQTESNAKKAIRFIFNPDDVDEVKFPSFCAFMALFAPYKTAQRKLRDFFNMSNEFQDKIRFTDPIDFVEEDIDTEANLIQIDLDSDHSIYAYNLPHVPYGGEYLVDDKGNFYKTWTDFLEANSQISSTETTGSSQPDSIINSEEPNGPKKEEEEHKSEKDIIPDTTSSTSDDI